MSDQNEAHKVDQIVTDDWSFIAEVDNSRYVLEDIQQTLPVQDKVNQMKLTATGIQQAVQVQQQRDILIQISLVRSTFYSD